MRAQTLALTFWGGRRFGQMRDGAIIQYDGMKSAHIAAYSGHQLNASLDRKRTSETHVKLPTTDLMLGAGSFRKSLHHNSIV